ncbi:MAG: aromatic amino acid transaminase [Pseudomonadota bacterium]
MTDFMSRLEPAAPDALLSLMLAAREDDRPTKADLSVGIYKDKTGATPVLQSVAAAEDLILRTQTTKAYESPQGNPIFCAEVETLTMGRRDDRRAVFMTPGGSGALFIAFRLAASMAQGATVWMSDPTWPNHRGIVGSAGFAIESFPYQKSEDGSVDVEAMLDALERAQAGDIVLLQGACHNPTGTDLSADGWKAVADFVLRNKLLPVVDVAYQGFAIGLDEDMAPIRALFDAVPEAMLTFSCSKNFGLYRDRVGALIVQAADASTCDVAKSQTSATVRTAYSMPPAHGAAIVATILTDDSLRKQWTDELTSMRQRLRTLREGFNAALIEATGRNSLMLHREYGMFSVLPISAEATQLIQKERGVYLPTSGRINIAGLNEDRLQETAEALAPYLSD